MVMSRLTEGMGLTEKSLQSLHHSKICSVLEFLQEGTERISSICNISFKEVLEVRQNLISRFSAFPTSGTSAYDHLLKSSALIQSGVLSLDSLLDGGFLTGAVLELCGQSGDGKTQLCLTIAANVASVLQQAVHYIDTTWDFSAHRLHEIIKHKNIADQDCRRALERIEVAKINNIYELIHFLHQFKTALGEDENSLPRVVIIDSMPALYFPFMGGETNLGFGLLNNVMATMKSLATEYHILFIVVNLASMFVEGEAWEGGELRESEGNEARPMLGKYWLHAPNTRLLITKPSPPSETTQRLIRVINSSHLSLGKSCIVSVCHKGVF